MQLHSWRRRLPALRMYCTSDEVRSDAKMPAKRPAHSTRPATKPRLFVSYAREDAGAVGIMVSMIRLGGPSIFQDTASLGPGDEWRPAIVSAISRCSTILVFWCRHARASAAVRREWQQALREHKRIVPVLLDSTLLPHKLARYQWIDCRSLMDETSHRGQSGAESTAGIRRPVIHRFIDPTHLAGMQARRSLWIILSTPESSEVTSDSAAIQD